MGGLVLNGKTYILSTKKKEVGLPSYPLASFIVEHLPIPLKWKVFLVVRLLICRRILVKE